MVYKCTTVIHRCTTVVYRWTTVIYRCARVAYRSQLWSTDELQLFTEACMMYSLDAVQWSIAYSTKVYRYSSLYAVERSIDMYCTLKTTVLVVFRSSTVVYTCSTLVPHPFQNLCITTRPTDQYSDRIGLVIWCRGRDKSAWENQRQLTDWFPNLSVTPLPLDRQLSQRGAQQRLASLSDRQLVTAHLATDHISFFVSYQRCGQKINNLSERYVEKMARNVYDRQSLVFNTVCFSRKCN